MTDLIHCILIEGLDDWVAIDTLICHSEECERKGGRPFREEFRDALASMLQRRLIEVGDLLDEGFAVRRRDPDSVVRQLEQELDEMAWDPKRGACWLRNTAAGDEFARNAGRSTCEEDQA